GASALMRTTDDSSETCVCAWPAEILLQVSRPPRRVNSSHIGGYHTWMVRDFTVARGTEFTNAVNSGSGTDRALRRRGPLSPGVFWSGVEWRSMKRRT